MVFVSWLCLIDSGFTALAHDRPEGQSTRMSRTSPFKREMKLGAKTVGGSGSEEYSMRGWSSVSSGPGPTNDRISDGPAV
jgi:hypothetical protein